MLGPSHSANPVLRERSVMCISSGMSDTLSDVAEAGRTGPEVALFGETQGLGGG